MANTALEPADRCVLGREIVFREYSACENAEITWNSFIASNALREAIERRWLEVKSDGTGRPLVCARHYVGIIPCRCGFDEDHCPEGGEHLILIKPKGDRRDEFGGLLGFLDLTLWYPPEKPSLQEYTVRSGEQKHVVILGRHYALVLTHIFAADPSVRLPVLHRGREC